MERRKRQFTLGSLMVITTVAALIAGIANWVFQTPLAVVPFVFISMTALGIGMVGWTRNNSITLLSVAAVVASVPFYGFYVHAARDPQWMAIVIVMAWFLTWVFAIASIVLVVIRPPDSFTAKSGTYLLLAYLLIAGVIGYWGVAHAFYELVVG